MKKKIMIITFMLCIIFMGKGYCCEETNLDYTKWGTSDFENQLECKLEEIFTFDNYLYFYPKTTTSGTDYFAPTSNNQNIYICLFYNDINYRTKLASGGTTSSIQYYNSKQNSPAWLTTYKCYETTINRFKNFEKSGYMNNYVAKALSNGTIVHSSLEIKDDNNQITIQKTINYTKTGCPTCEVCDECNCEGGQEGECGPVEITNFPINKGEFYMLLILISTLIFMLFFKWCFPMSKGGKK